MRRLVALHGQDSPLDVSKPSSLASGSNASFRRFDLIRRRIAITAVAVAASFALLAPGAARADHCIAPKLLGDCHATPSPTPSPTPSNSSTPKPKPKPSSSSNPSQPSPSQPNGSGPAPALKSSVRYVLDIAGTARNTQRLLDLIGRLKPLGAPPTGPELVRGFGRFPVVGYVWYHDDYGAPRYTPYFHLHEGVDLFAVAGTPVIATVDGVIEKIANGTIGGISIWLKGDDGITYYYGHLQGYAPGVVAGKRVRLGEVMGFVGDTGVAKGTYPHLHFEVHPGGGPPVSPKPVLDSWLIQAETSAVDAYQRIVEYNALNQLGGARWQAMFDLLREPAARVPALWQVALDPAASALGLDVAFDRLAWGSAPVNASQTATGIESDALAIAGPSWQNPLWSIGWAAPATGPSLASFVR
jgi:murein DD-endopeptidase MepM/ murein hydrolase activator NlpD